MSVSKITLGELAKEVDGSIQTGPFGSQLHQRDYQEEGTPVVMPQDIKDDRVNTESIARISDEMVRKLARHQLKIGDIVYPRRGDLSKRAIITEEQEGWLCGTGCLKISVSGGSIDPKYLFYFLKQPRIVTQIEQKAVGATMLNLNTKIVSGLEITYPTLPEQQRIADILSAYDDLIDNNKRRIALLEEAIHRLYREWFVHLRFPGYEHIPLVAGVPEGWEKRPLGDIAQEMTRRVHPSELHEPVPYVGLEHIPRQSIALVDWASSEDVTSSKFRFEKGEILFGKIRPYFHKVVFAPISGICSSDTIIIRPFNQDYHGLILAVASSESFVQFASKTAKEGSKMPRANWKVMAQYPILLPSNKVLADFENFVSSATRQIETLVQSNRKLQEARDALLPRLMNGRLLV